MLVENLSVPTDGRVWRQCRTLRRAGYDVVVICPQGRGDESARHTVLEGVTIHRYSLPQAEDSRLGYLSEYPRAFWQTFRLARALSAEGRFAVVHAANPPDFLLTAVWPMKRRGTSFVFDQHDLVPELYLSRFDKKAGVMYRSTLALERLSFRLADVVISPNTSYARIATGRGKKRPDDVFVVRNGPDASVFRAVPSEPALKRGKPFLIGYVGLMAQQDGVDEAVRALAMLRDARDDWHAVFVGDGEAAGANRILAAELGLDGLVEFTGFLPAPEVVRILSTADVCLAPEPSSPFNDSSTFIKVAEYMALGRPVVAFDLAETRNTAGSSAAYAAPGDTAGLAARISELLDDPERRRQMGTLARERVDSELAWEHSQRSLLAAYERALSRPVRRRRGRSTR